MTNFYCMFILKGLERKINMSENEKTQLKFLKIKILKMFGIVKKKITTLALLILLKLLLEMKQSMKHLTHLKQLKEALPIINLKNTMTPG